MATFLLRPPLPPGHREIHRRSIMLLCSSFSIPKPSTLSYELKEGQSCLFHHLPSGLRMEVILHKARCSSSSSPSQAADTYRFTYPNAKPVPDLNPNPPLVFVHGSFHAAWCWAEHWLPFFSSYGYDCYAVSLLGQGESDIPDGTAAGTLQTHTSDIADFIEKEVKLPPVLIGHSFGGLIVQSYLSNMKRWHASAQLSSSGSINIMKLMVSSSHRQSCSCVETKELHPLLSGAVLVCSVPPSGNSGLVWRYLKTKPIAAIKVTLSLAAKAFANSFSLCKETFFSLSMDESLVRRYQQLMRESSNIPLFDLKKLNASLPVSPIPKDSVDLLIMGASGDFIVDNEGLQETANFYNVQPISVVGVAHDMMLDSSWERGAEIVLSWLDGLRT